MDTLQEAAIMMIEIDRQTYFNKLQYDRTLSEEQKEVIAIRLKATENELQNLNKHAEDNANIHQIGQPSRY